MQIIYAGVRCYIYIVKA